MLNSPERKCALVNLCSQLSSTFSSSQPLIHRRGEGHSHVEDCRGTAGCICQTTRMQILHTLPPTPLPASLLPQVLTLTTTQWLDQTPAVKEFSKILLKTLDCQLHWQLHCCYLNLKLILQPWPQIVQRRCGISSKFLTTWNSGGMSNTWWMNVPTGCNLTLLKFMGTL